MTSDTSQKVNEWLDTLSDASSVSSFESDLSDTSLFSLSDGESCTSIHGDTDSEESDLEGFISETADELLWASKADPDWTS